MSTLTQLVGIIGRVQWRALGLVKAVAQIRENFPFPTLAEGMRGKGGGCVPAAVGCV